MVAVVEYSNIEFVNTFTNAVVYLIHKVIMILLDYQTRFNLQAADTAVVILPVRESIYMHFPNA